MTSSSAPNVRPTAAPTPSTGKSPPERGEVPPRPHSPPHPRGPPAEAHIHGVTEPAEHAAENSIPLAKIAIQRVGHGISARIVAIFHATNGEERQLLGILH